MGNKCSRNVPATASKVQPNEANSYAPSRRNSSIEQDAKIDLSEHSEDMVEDEPNSQVPSGLSAGDDSIGYRSSSSEAQLSLIAPMVADHVLQDAEAAVLSGCSQLSMPFQRDSEVVAAACDISGFSKLCSSLGDMSAYGQSNSLFDSHVTEDIRDYASNIFEVLITAISSSGGDTLSIAGDLLLASWDLPKDSSQIPELASRAVCAVAKAIEQIETLFYGGSFELGLHAAMSIGHASVGVVSSASESRAFFTPFGPAFETAMGAIDLAGKGKVVVSNVLGQRIRLESSVVKLEQHDNTEFSNVRKASGWHVHEGINNRKAIMKRLEAMSAENIKTVVSMLSTFIPKAILPMLATSGIAADEIYWATMVFVNLEMSETSIHNKLNSLHSLAQVLCKETHQRNGSVKEISIDDKDVAHAGVVGVAAFGTGLSSKEEMKIDFKNRAELSGCHTARSLPECLPGFAMSIGIASGFVFVGSVGTDERREISISGLPVIRAARLMAKGSKSSKTRVLVDDQTRNSTCTDIAYTSKGEINVKGLQSVQVYKMLCDFSKGASEKNALLHRNASVPHERSFASDVLTNESSSSGGSNVDDEEEEQSNDFFTSIISGLWPSAVQALEEEFQRCNAYPRTVLIRGPPFSAKTELLKSFVRRLIAFGCNNPQKVNRVKARVNIVASQVSHINAKVSVDAVVIAVTFTDPEEASLSREWSDFVAQLDQLRRSEKINNPSKPREFSLLRLVALLRGEMRNVAKAINGQMALDGRAFREALVSATRSILQKIVTKKRKTPLLVFDNINGLSKLDLRIVRRLSQRLPKGVLMIASGSVDCHVINDEVRVADAFPVFEYQLRLYLPAFHGMQNRPKLNDTAASFLWDRSSGLLGLAELILQSGLQDGSFVLEEGTISLATNALDRIQLPTQVYGSLLVQIPWQSSKYQSMLEVAALTGTVSLSSALSLATDRTSFIDLEDTTSVLFELEGAGVLTRVPPTLVHVALWKLFGRAEDEFQPIFAYCSSTLQEAVVNAIGRNRKRTFLLNIARKVHADNAFDSSEDSEADTEFRNLAAELGKSTSSCLLKRIITASYRITRSTRAQQAAISCLCFGVGMQSNEVDLNEKLLAALLDTIILFDATKMSGRSFEWLTAHAMLLPHLAPMCKQALDR